MTFQVSYADEKFSPFEKGKNPATPIEPLVADAKVTAEVSHVTLCDCHVTLIFVAPH